MTMQPATGPKFTDTDRYMPRPDPEGHTLTSTGAISPSGTSGFRVTCSCGVVVADWVHLSSLLTVQNQHRIDAEHGPRCDGDPGSWFGRGRWPRCACGFDPHDNAALTAHWADAGFEIVADGSQLVRRPVAATGGAR